MSRRSHSTGAVFSACSVIMLSFTVAACSGGRSASVAQDSNAPMAAETVAAQEVTQPPQSEPNETVHAAPKRSLENPIFVRLIPTVLDSKMRQAEKPKGAIDQYIRNEFASDPVIQLIPEPKGKMGRKTSQTTPRIADVEVASKVSRKEVLGINDKTGKSSKTVNVVFEATITSQSPPAIYTVMESGHILQNMAVAKRFAKQVREVIVEKISPEIPAR